VYANRAFFDVSGYTPEEVLGKNCRFLQGTDRKQPMLKVLRSAILAEKPCRVTLRNYKKSGEMFWNELSVAPVFDDEGNLQNFIAVQTDVTRERKTQQFLNDYYAAMGRELQKPLSIAAANLKRFSSAASPNPSSQQSLTTLGSNLEEILKLVGAYLTLDPSQFEEITLNPTSVNPEQLIAGVFSLWSPLAEKRAIELVMKIKSAEHFKADSVLLSNVLTNLVSNAIKFSPANTTVTVIVEKGPQGVKFTVQDLGTGIEPGELEKLFQHTPEHGLGLAVSKFLIELHKGTIGVNSLPNKGSSFWFTIPLTERKQRAGKSNW
jgi:PAS domain S-box-containing protein